MQQRKIDIWVGVFALLGVLALVALTLSVGAKGWGSKKATYAVTAKFSGVGTLKVDAPVKMSGVEIGRVRDIQLVDDQGEYKALVTMAIHQGMKLPKDSLVNIYTAGLLGAQFVSISQGADAQNLVGDGGALTETEQAMQFEEALKNFGVNKMESDAKTDSGVSQPQ